MEFHDKIINHLDHLAETNILTIQNTCDEIKGWATVVDLFDHGECAQVHGLAAHGHLREMALEPGKVFLNNSRASSSVSMLIVHANAT